jgi:hypothetical protein
MVNDKRIHDMASGQTSPQYHDDSGSRPVPDPTQLTTAQLERAIAALKELFQTRLDGMDKAIILLQQAADRQPTTAIVALGIESLRELMNERFKTVELQFLERDTRTEQSSRDSKVAVDAALQAQKESVNAQNISNAAAIAKSETAFTKQIDQIAALISTTSLSASEKIDDVKTSFTRIEARINTIEGRTQGSDKSGATMATIISIAVAAVAVVISAVSYVGGNRQMPASYVEQPHASGGTPNQSTITTPLRQAP